MDDAERMKLLARLAATEAVLVILIGRLARLTGHISLSPSEILREATETAAWGERLGASIAQVQADRVQAEMRALLAPLLRPDPPA